MFEYKHTKTRHLTEVGFLLLWLMQSHFDVIVRSEHVEFKLHLM